jgi:hypothetical protein
MRRESSTHAPQALELLNGRTANELARAFAARLRSEAGGNVEGQVEPPTPLGFEPWNGRITFEMFTRRSSNSWGLIRIG